MKCVRTVEHCMCQDVLKPIWSTTTCNRTAFYRNSNRHGFEKIRASNGTYKPPRFSLSILLTSFISPFNMYYSLALFLGAFTPFVLSTVLDSDRQHSVQDMHGNCIQLDIASLDTVKSLLSSRIADLPASASTLGADHVVSRPPLVDFYLIP